jgi:sugar phosphate isomerase/epimerase
MTSHYFLTQHSVSNGIAGSLEVFFGEFLRHMSANRIRETVSSEEDRRKLPTRELPVLGACLTVPFIAQYRDWLFDSDRDVEVQGFTSARALDGDWLSVAQEAKRLLDGHKGRIGIHGPTTGFQINAADPEIQAVIQKRMMQGLDVCDVLGGTHMVIHSAYTSWEQHNFQNVKHWRQHFIDMTHLVLDKVIERAEQQGVIIVIENVADIAPAERRLLAQSFDSDNLRLSVDTGHAHFAHVTHGAPPADYFIHDAGALLEHVHLHDADGYADRHWSIGRGTVPWHAVFAEIAEIAALGHMPRLMLELRYREEVPSSYTYLVDQKLVR